MDNALINYLLEKTQASAEKYDELDKLIGYPEIIADGKYWRLLVAQRAGLEPMAALRKALSGAVREYSACLSETENCEEGELLAELKAEAQRKEKQAEQYAAQLKKLLAEQSEEADGVIIELRATATAESYAFCKMLTDVYLNYAKSNGFVCNAQGTSAEGGSKSATLTIEGAAAYSLLKGEGGSHRCIFVGNKEGAVTAVVLPKERTEETPLLEKDYRLDVFHSQGAGGQNVNKVETAIRITHYPTGIVVTCQDERSQRQNKERALMQLQQKLNEYYARQSRQRIEQSRKEQLQAAAREKRRVYNTVTRQVADRNGTVLPLDKALTGEIDILLSL